MGSGTAPVAYVILFVVIVALVALYRSQKNPVAGLGMVFVAVGAMMFLLSRLGGTGLFVLGGTELFILGVIMYALVHARGDDTAGRVPGVRRDDQARGATVPALPE